MPTTMRHVFGVSVYGEHADGQDVATAPTMQRLISKATYGQIRSSTAGANAF